MRIFIAGGTGLVGSRLVKRLLERGDQVSVLTRRPEMARAKWGETCTVVAGDPMQSGAWIDAVGECDAVVNLVGEGVFNRRWRRRFKDLMLTSRVESTTNIVAALARSPRRADGAPRVLVNASAIGYYGAHGDEELDESSGPGDDTLARLCVEWEKAAAAAAGHGVRTVIVRVGVVLDREGGALAKMLLPFKMFMGGPVGSGKQWVSWIHHDDLVGLILLGLDSPHAAGPMNGTAPNPVTNKELAKAIGRVLHRPSFMPTPRLALRVMLGEVAGLVTAGQRVLPRKALELGHAFTFPEIDAALRDILC
jgi:uncharacterized protein (TIGR01777 family)